MSELGTGIDLHGFNCVTICVLMYVHEMHIKCIKYVIFEVFILSR